MNVEVGSAVKLGDSEFSCYRTRELQRLWQPKGDIPWAFRGGAEHQFVDLQGDNGVFATFEYGASTNAYVGKEVSLDSLALEGDGWDVLDAQSSPRLHP